MPFMFRGGGRQRGSKGKGFGGGRGPGAIEPGGPLQTASVPSAALWLPINQESLVFRETALSAVPL